MYDAQRSRQQLTAVLAWRPEWPAAVLALLAWLLLVASAVHPDASTLPHQHGSVPAAAGPAVLPGTLSHWLLMAVAMMLPVTLPAVRHVGLNSVRRRRQWAMTVYVAGYVGIWTVFGLVAIALERVATQTLRLGAGTTLALALVIAAGWQLTRPKRRAVLRCRSTVPLPPVGRRADAGCVRFALQQGWRCVVSCWALMLVMVAVGRFSLLWMAALTGLVALEELTRAGRRMLRPSAAALATAAVLVGISGI